eukprot:scaffold9.g3153.t1
MAPSPVDFALDPKSDLGVDLTAAVQAKLQEYLGASYSDSSLALYVVVMLAHSTKQSALAENLVEFLGEADAKAMAEWLFGMLPGFIEQHRAQGAAAAAAGPGVTTTFAGARAVHVNTLCSPGMRHPHAGPPSITDELELSLLPDDTATEAAMPAEEGSDQEEGRAAGQRREQGQEREERRESQRRATSAAPSGGGRRLASAVVRGGPPPAESEWRGRRRSRSRSPHGASRQPARRRSWSPDGRHRRTAHESRHHHFHSHQHHHWGPYHHDARGGRSPPRHWQQLREREHEWGGERARGVRAPRSPSPPRRGGGREAGGRSWRDAAPAPRRRSLSPPRSRREAGECGGRRRGEEPGSYDPRQPSVFERLQEQQQQQEEREEPQQEEEQRQQHDAGAATGAPAFHAGDPAQPWERPSYMDLEVQQRQQAATAQAAAGAQQLLSQQRRQQALMLQAAAGQFAAAVAAAAAPGAAGAAQLRATAALPPGTTLRVTVPGLAQWQQDGAGAREVLELQQQQGLAPAAPLVAQPELQETLRKCLRSMELELVELRADALQARKQEAEAARPPSASAKLDKILRTVCVSNVHTAATERVLIAHFGREPSTGRKSGVVQIEFSDAAEAQNALALSGSALLQQVIQVVPSDSPAAKAAASRVLRGAAPAVPPVVVAVPVPVVPPVALGGRWSGRGGRSGCRNVWRAGARTGSGGVVKRRAFHWSRPAVVGEEQQAAQAEGDQEGRQESTQEIRQ